MLKKCERITAFDFHSHIDKRAGVSFFLLSAQGYSKGRGESGFSLDRIVSSGFGCISDLLVY